MSIEHIKQVYIENEPGKIWNRNTIGLLLSRIDALEKSEESMSLLIVSLKTLISMIPNEQIKEMDERWDREGPEISTRFMEGWEKPGIVGKIRAKKRVKEFIKACDEWEKPVRPVLDLPKPSPTEIKQYSNGTWSVWNGDINVAGYGDTQTEAWLAFTGEAERTYAHLEANEENLGKTLTKNLKAFRRMVK